MIDIKHLPLVEDDRSDLELTLVALEERNPLTRRGVKPEVGRIGGWLRLLRFANDGSIGFKAVHAGRLVFRRMRYGAASSLTWKPISGLGCSGGGARSGRSFW